jgi:hypothetical protein
MCLHDPDGMRGFNAACPASTHCLCGLFHPEYGQVPPPRQRSGGGTMSVVRIAASIVLAWLVINAIAFVLAMVFQDENERRRS